MGLWEEREAEGLWPPCLGSARSCMWALVAVLCPSPELQFPLFPPPPGLP